VTDLHHAHPTANSPFKYFLALTFAAYTCVAGVLAFLDPLAAFVAIILPLLILPLLVFTQAVEGRKWAILSVLALSIFLLEAVFRVRAYDEKVVDFQIVMKAVSWLALLTIAAMNAGPALHKILSTASLPWTLLFFYFLLTSLYAPNLAHSAVAAVSILSFYIIFASMTTRVETSDILIAILAGIVILTIASLAVYFINPSFGRLKVWSGEQQVLSSRLSGLAGHPNTIGRLCCFGLLVTVNQWKKLAEMWRPLPVLTFLLLAGTLLLSNSRTSLGITILLLSIYWFARARFLPYMIFVAVVGIFGFLLLESYVQQIMELLSRSGKAEEIATGTSRTHIWAVVEILIAEKPWFGWGYGASVFIMPPYQRFMGHAAPHAHNVFLQLWLTTGIVGLALFVFAFVMRLYVAIRFNDRFVVIILLFVILNGLSESSAFGGVANITSVALCLAATTRKWVDDSARPG
jgi:exopolysaccharide production protein ExoQ